jgi:glycosyltransferase involved in cell wall biosynthesis
VKIIEVTNVDFAMRHFVWPLMQAIRAEGHEVTGACAEGERLAPVRADGFRVEPLPTMRSASPIAMWRAFRALVQLFAREKPDLVHAHMPVSGFIARLAASYARVPRIAYTCHGFLFNQQGSPLRRAASFAMEFLAGKVTDVFLTVSAEEAADAKRLWINRRAVAVLNGRDPARFHPDRFARARIRASLGVPEPTIAVVIVSRLVRHKGHAELAAAMQGLDAELWVVGERLPSDRGEDVQAALAESGLGARLRLLGYREDIPAILAAADIFALPSHFEGLPMSVIEAMLTALPVVATDIRGPREQVEDGETGFLVPSQTVPPLRAALIKLIADEALRSRMGAAGRERAIALYDEATVIARTLDHLGLKGHRPAP